jgi:hypothetical protein
LVELDQELSKNDYNDLVLFRYRFDELWENWQGLVREGLSLSGRFSVDGEGQLDGGENLGISRFRVKGFLVDYRHFTGNKEPVKFERICNILNRHSSNSRVRKLILHEKGRWKNAPSIAGWHNDFSADDVINAVINGEYFHSNPTAKSAVSLAEVRKRMSERALLWCITEIAHSRLLCIRNINFLLGPVYERRNFVKIPEEHSAYQT